MHICVCERVQEDMSTSDIEFARLDRQIASLLDQKPLTEKEVYDLCERAKEMLADEDNIEQVRVPVTIVGDVHGQLGDLKEMLAIAGSQYHTPTLDVYARCRAQIQTWVQRRRKPTFCSSAIT